MTDTTPSTIHAPWAERCELLNWANITYRYHRKRQRFFEKCDMVTQLASVVMGLSIFGKTLQDHLPMIGLAIAVLGLLALVVRYGDRTQCHKLLAEDARKLAGEIEALPYSDLKDKHISRWNSTRTDIEKREPPNLKTLVAKCEWEQATAEGHPDHAPKVNWFRQMHMHFF